MKGGVPTGARLVLAGLSLVLLVTPPLMPLMGSEVIEETHTRVIVREHPKTGKPYVSIVSSDDPDPKDPFTGPLQKFSRPDYRMLDPKIKAKDIPYHGPSSDRRKVYVLAATLATVGTAGGAAGILAAPAATGAGAAGGAGAYLAGAGAVAGTATAASVYATTGSKEDNFIHRSESKEKAI